MESENGIKYLFQLILIFKRISDQQLAEYVCLYRLDTKQYAVLCTNFYNSTSSNDDHTYFKKLTIELLLEESPLSRCKWFSSTQKAINQQELDFS